MTEIICTSFFRHGRGNDDKCYDATVFACKLTMPEDKVRELIDSGVKNIGDLADVFEVPASAVMFWVKYLGYKLKQDF